MKKIRSLLALIAIVATPMLSSALGIDLKVNYTGSNVAGQTSCDVYLSPSIIYHVFNTGGENFTYSGSNAAYTSIQFKFNYVFYPGWTTPLTLTRSQITSMPYGVAQYYTAGGVRYTITKTQVISIYYPPGTFPDPNNIDYELNVYSNEMNL